MPFVFLIKCRRDDQNYLHRAKIVNAGPWWDRDQVSGADLERLAVQVKHPLPTGNIIDIRALNIVEFLKVPPLDIHASDCRRRIALTVNSQVDAVLAESFCFLDRMLVLGHRFNASCPPEAAAIHDIKGDPEIPEFVEFRYSMLVDNPDSQVLAFTAESHGLRGVSTLLLWEDEMEMCEIGLTGDDSPERHALYVSLGFDQPFQYAKARGGISRIRYGTTAETPKRSRGAVYKDRYCGLLSMDETKRLARSGS